MARLTLSPWITANWNLLMKKRLILFSVSGTPPQEEKALRGILANSLTPEKLQRMEYFPLHGRLRMSSLPFFMRILMKAMSKKSQKQGMEDRRMAEFDGVKRQNIEPVVRAVGAA
jgi:hypothetical protein